MNPLDAFKATISGGQAVAPSASPLGSFPELAQYYSAASKLPQVSAGVGALSGAAKTQYGDQLAQDDYNRQVKAAELKDQASQMKDIATNPEKYYKQVLKPDGGYDFLDPAGKKITVQTYAQAVGKQPSQVLAKSENSLDRQFIQDHKHVEETVNAIYNNDGAYFTKLQKEDPEEYTALREIIKGAGNNEKAVQDILNKFKSAYPNVYNSASGQSPQQRGPQKTVQDALGGGSNVFEGLKKVLGGLFG